MERSHFKPKFYSKIKSLANQFDSGSASNFIQQLASEAFRSILGDQLHERPSPSRT